MAGGGGGGHSDWEFFRSGSVASSCNLYPRAHTTARYADLCPKILGGACGHSDCFLVNAGRCGDTDWEFLQNSSDSIKSFLGGEGKKKKVFRLSFPTPS